MKAEKPPGPPPFASPTAIKFEVRIIWYTHYNISGYNYFDHTCIASIFFDPGQTPDGALRGLQVSLRLCNVCAFQDKIFVVLFGNLPPSATAPVHTNALITPPGAGGGEVHTIFGSTGSKWTQISRTEVR